MKDEPKKHRDRYDTTGNIEAEYVDEAETVLVNKKGITDLETLQVEEEECLAKAYESLLSEVRIDTLMTCELLLHIHERIFDDLYEWAGQYRTVNISKPGTTWPPPIYIDQSMQEFERTTLAKYPASVLADDDAFCKAVAEIQGEFLVIHPFREGNARTIKMMCNLLAAQSGRPLLKYDTSDEARDSYIAAAKAAFTRKYGLMTDIIRRALTEARSQSDRT
jgi:cell filamentation protein